MLKYVATRSTYYKFRAVGHVWSFGHPGGGGVVEGEGERAFFMWMWTRERESAMSMFQGVKTC